MLRKSLKIANLAKTVAGIQRQQQKKTNWIYKSEDESRSFARVNIIQSTKYREEMLFQIGVREFSHWKQLYSVTNLNKGFVGFCGAGVYFTHKSYRSVEFHKICFHHPCSEAEGVVLQSWPKSLADNWHKYALIYTISKRGALNYCILEKKSTCRTGNKRTVRNWTKKKKKKRFSFVGCFGFFFSPNGKKEKRSKWEKVEIRLLF